MRRWLKDKVRNGVVVYTLDDKILEGVLSVSADEGVVLINTIIHDTQNIPLAGDIFIPRENIRYVQVARARRP